MDILPFSLCFVLACFWNGVYVHAQMKGITRSEFLQAFLEDYDSRIPPSFDFQHASNVYVKIAFENIDSISEQTMDFSSSLMITQEWTDHRLEFFGLIDAPFLELDAKMIERVWVPDLYFANEKRAKFHDITVPNRMMHLYSNGTVRYQARVTLTASCPMFLQRYPMDSQVCSLKIKSFAYSKNNVIFHWHDVHPIRADRLELPQFQLARYTIHNCCRTSQNCSDDITGENVSCLRVDLHLEREIGYYMIQMYIPSIMIVALSWVSFWLSIDAVPARISLGILTVLTMTTQKTAAISSLPKVSYVKAIDVWMATCLSFVFAALLEYALVNVQLRREVKRRRSIRDGPGINLVDIKSQGPDCEGVMSHNSSETKPDCKWILDPRGKRRATFVDKASRLFFPLSFVTFCGIYWIVYCVF